MPSPPPLSTLFPYTTLFRSYSCHSLLIAKEVTESVFTALFVDEPRTMYQLAHVKQKSIIAIVGVKLDLPETQRCDTDLINLMQSDRKSTRLNSSHITISYAVSTSSLYPLSLHDALPILLVPFVAHREGSHGIGIHRSVRRRAKNHVPARTR